MRKRAAGRWRASILWGLGLGLLLLSGGVVGRAQTASKVAGPVGDARVRVSGPVARAGEDYNAVTGAPTTLDGSDSFDPNKGLLTFTWKLTRRPRSSTAALADPTRPNPTFTPDLPGQYRFTLVVNNGERDSRRDRVTVTAFAPGNAPPNAHPGPDQWGFVGTPVVLDGSDSDDPEGAPLTFLWSFTSLPLGSALTNANLAARDTAGPSFIPDVPGTYRITLRVSDGALTDDAIVGVVVSPTPGPNADAGPDQVVTGLAPVTLDGRGSNDPDGGPSPLSYSWWLVSRPPGSALASDALQDATTATPTFTPDVVGPYIWRLHVSDGASSDEDNVLIEALQGTANQPPVAQDDVATTDEDVPVIISVLGNDSDPDGDPLTITGVTQGAKGGVSIGGVNVTYTPTLNLNGTDSFTYSISDGRGGTATATVRVTINPVNDAPTVTLGADQTSGPAPLAVAFTATATDVDGDPLTYAWNFGDGTTKPSGSASEGHTYQATGPFTATVTVSDGQATAQASLTITPAGVPDPSTVAPPLSQTSTTDLGSGTAFLYSGSNPIQTGVAPGTITLTRAAVLRGRGLNSLGTPLPGIAISILNHPEFGQTQTRADGWFDLAVNGGGLLTVAYAKTGYLPAQRGVNVPWQDFAILPDVVLIQPDPNVTAIDLAAAIPFQIARGSVITDTDGTRQDTLLFAQGTSASMTFPDGTTQPLGPIIHVRATEYTVGALGLNAMPGALPPTSAYTNATDFHVDESSAAGALLTTFSQPVLSYIENFLGFPTGTTVPMGAYDATKGIWVPAESGVVIKILSITGGLADLDTDGDGLADNGVALGVTAAERQQLASLYGAGTSLWRTPVTHFSPWDRNWGWGPPPDAQPRRGPRPKADPRPKNPTKCNGSIVGCEDQTLGEALSVSGTPFSLHYQSDWVPGRTAARILDISLSGPSVPASLTRIDLEVRVAGRLFTQTFPPNPNQSTTFAWDGLDAYGRMVQGQYPATVRIGYVYDGVYQVTDRFGYNGNGIPITGSKTRREVTLWQIDTVMIGVWDARGQGLGGWTLSVHHAYDPMGKVLYLGNGSRRSANGITPMITTVAGTYECCFLPFGDGGPATQAVLGFTQAVAVAPDGSLYIAINDHRIRRVGPDGIITTVAGTGVFGFSGDGGPATLAKMAGPRGVAVAPDGSLYIADVGNLFIVNTGNRIRRVGPDGIITTVAGTESHGFSGGDGGPATQAPLDRPWAVAVAPDGSFYITAGSHIRRVKSALQGFSATDVAIPSEDGREVYQFDANGRHLRTLHALTGATLLQFTYDSDGRLTQVTDGDGNVTTIQRDGAGQPTAIVAPFGQQKTLALDSNGFLAGVTDPAAATTQLTSSSDGLLATLTDPKGNLHQFTYDSLGRLIKDQDPAGGFLALNRTETPGTSTYSVTLSSALGRTSTFQVEQLSTGDERRVNTDPAGLQSTLLIN